MSPYRVPLANIAEALHLAAPPGMLPAPDTLEDLLAGAARVCEAVVLPSEAIGEREPPRFLAGRVVVPSAVRRARDALSAVGLAAAMHPPSHGGLGLPSTVQFALNEMAAASNFALSLCLSLTHAVARLVDLNGTEEQRRRWLPDLLSGRLAGTMCLTEPDAGSDLARIATRAGPDGSGLTGTKIYISWGEHDLADGILHLVLARTGRGAGLRGLALHLVPSRFPDGTPNAVSCLGIEDKLGLAGSPTCTLRFENAVGERLGGDGAGLVALGRVLGWARLGVAVQGVALVDRARQAAAAFSTERRQSPAFGRMAGEALPIREHPDVARMLERLDVHARVLRVMTLHAVAVMDAAHAGDAGAQALAALLTPVCKTFTAESAVAMTSEALQIHGGAGFIETTGIARLYRDARILPIYEGTTAIQANDFLVRQAAEGRGFELLLEDAAPLVAALGSGALGEALADVGRLAAEASQAVRHRLADDPPSAAYVAVPFLRLWSLQVAGAAAARLALAGHSRLGAVVATQMLPEAEGLARTVRLARP